MLRDEFDEILKGLESQTVEFKTSPAEQSAGIQTMVAFANSQGGKVFFGVKDDGTVVGVDMGKNTLENLSTAIRDHTYPSLPVDSIEEIDFDGKKVVLVECPSDVPPVVGVYLCSTSSIPLDQPVDVHNLQAYRRVGKSTLQEDFMRLRKPQPSDPRLRLSLFQGSVYIDSPGEGEITGRAWIEENSATAHSISFHLDALDQQSPDTYADIPYPAGGAFIDRVPLVNAALFQFTNVGLTSLPAQITVSVRYSDDWGLIWEASRRILPRIKGMNLLLVDSGNFRRRIVCFPPKANRGVTP
ncbi:MAG: ATP-binding protein [Chloroflexi bacterium]|nr:ATP-binding protein [Chloroflexota bacterium]